MDVHQISGTKTQALLLCTEHLCVLRNGDRSTGTKGKMVSSDIALLCLRLDVSIEGQSWKGPIRPSKSCSGFLEFPLSPNAITTVLLLSKSTLTNSDTFQAFRRERILRDGWPSPSSWGNLGPVQLAQGHPGSTRRKNRGESDSQPLAPLPDNSTTGLSSQHQVVP